MLPPQTKASCSKMSYQRGQKLSPKTMIPKLYQGTNLCARTCAARARRLRAAPTAHGAAPGRVPVPRACATRDAAGPRLFSESFRITLAAASGGEPAPSAADRARRAEQGTTPGEEGAAAARPAKPRQSHDKMLRGKVPPRRAARHRCRLLLQRRRRASPPPQVYVIERERKDCWL